MKNTTCRALIGAMLLAASEVGAQTTPKFPDMTGHWNCNIEYGSYFFDLLAGPYEYEMNINEQLGAAFKGYVVWIGDRDELPDEQINKPGQTIVAEEGTKVTIHEEFLGMIGWGDYNLHMVDLVDEGSYSGRIVQAGKSSLSCLGQEKTPQ
ncbi:MAG: hypothetical protein AAGI36_02540 [Pseudomonadota bacterium]